METREETPARPAGPAGMPDKALIMRLMFGGWVQQALYVVTKLGVADALAAGPTDVESLAEKTGTHAGALGRFLRALCSVGVFDEPTPGVFDLNGPAQYLRSDWPDTHKHIVTLHGEEAYAACVEALHTARTGKPAFDKVYGKPYFQYLAENAAARAAFDAAAGHTTELPLVVEEVDLSDARRLVDVTGGTGTFVVWALQRNPSLYGVVADLPAVADEAAAVLKEAGMQGRAEIVSGSCFESVPAGGDVYTIVRSLHDFDDEDALRVLGNIRAGIVPGGRLVLFDALLPDVRGFNPSRLADLGMLMVLGGRYRTESELRDLVVRAGFEVTRVQHAPPGSDPRAESLLEATAV